MSWPTPLDYLEAMQNPRASLGDFELQAGNVEEDKQGMPRPRGGSFASVYKLICSSRWWAVRCFLKEFHDQQERYAAISAQLAISKSKFPFATDFQFLKQGIRVSGIWYPVIKMEWVQGEDFIRHIESNLHSPAKLLSLGHDIVELARVLNREGVAHGDLQHGNILIANGKPKLIDYDGMYVSAFKANWKTHEAGHSNYQLPRDETDFGPGLDNFSVWVIYISLRALSIRPSLWTQFRGGDDCLLFRRKDFEAPAQSLLLQELKKIPEIQSLATYFQYVLTLSPLKVPPIDPGSPPKGPNGSGPTPPRPPGHQVPRPNGVYVRPNVPSARNPTPWPTTLAQIIPPKPVTPSILATPPMWTGPKGLATVPPQPSVPSILHSPPAWPGATGLPRLPPEPIPTGILDEPPPAMNVLPMRHKKKKIPASPRQKSLGFAALSSAGLFVLLLPFAALLVIGINGRLALAAVLVEIVPLVGFLSFGALWQRSEWTRRSSEQQFNEEYEAELAQLRAEAKRRKKEWEAAIAAKQARAQRVYEQEMHAWQATVSAIQAEGKRQHKHWQEELSARQAVAQGRYDQEMRHWKNLVETNQAESNRQKREWEAELAAKQQQARRGYDEELRLWQGVLSAMQTERNRREQAAKNAKQKVNDAEQSWAITAARFVSEYDIQTADLYRLYSDRNDIEVQRESEYKHLLSKARENQFANHLSKELIEVAAISDIGPARKKTLQAHGVRTALDVDEDRIMRIPRFKKALTANLMEWRRNVEATFIFKTALAIPPHEKQAFESKYEQRRQLIQGQIAAGETKLKTISQDAEKQLGQLTQQIIAILIQLHQAEADLTVIPKGL